MTEADILIRVSEIASEAKVFAGAVEKTRSVLEETLGARAFAVELPGDFFDTLDLPHRSLCSVPLRSGGRELGKVIACFPPPDFQGEALRRIMTYIGQQLGMLLERTRLVKDQAQLQDELAQLEDDLATRKIVQRAQGVLVARRGMTPAAAKLWISLQARQEEVSLREVADQVVAAENVRRQNLFTQGRHRRIA